MFLIFSIVVGISNVDCGVFANFVDKLLHCCIVAHYFVPITTQYIGIHSFELVLLLLKCCEDIINTRQLLALMYVCATDNRACKGPCTLSADMRECARTRADMRVIELFESSVDVHTTREFARVRNSRTRQSSV